LTKAVNDLVGDELGIGSSKTFDGMEFDGLSANAALAGVLVAGLTLFQRAANCSLELAW
jgi:hypothetical protein